LAGCALAAICYLPTTGMSLFHLLARSINPELAAFNDTSPAKLIVTADPAQCHFTIFPVKGWTAEGDCDKGKSILTSNGISFTSVDGAAGSKVMLQAGDAKVEGTSPYAWQKALADAGYPHFKVMEADFNLTKEQADALVKAQADKKAATDAKDAAATKTASTAIETAVNDLRKVADAAAKPIGAVNMIAAPLVAADGTATLHVGEIKTTTAKALSIAQYVQSILIVFAMMVFTTMVYGPIAAFLVEMFPSNVRYTSMSLPYHIGNGWFGGMLPLFATAYVAYTGNIFAGLWYPVVFAAITAIVGFLFLKETKDVDIAKN
jgi:hypothetical protein